MQTETTPARTSSGLATLLDVIVAPGTAFATLRERPYAGWAFLVTAALGMIGAFLLIPANEHISAAVLAAKFVHDPQYASMSPEQQARAAAIGKGIQQWLWLIYPLIVAVATVVTALVLLICSAIGGGAGNFRKAFALSVNVSLIVFGLGYLIYGVIGVVRGGDAFATQLDLLTSIPTPAMLAPGAGIKLATFLATVTPFQIWSCVLLAFGARTVMGTKPVVAWIGALVCVLLPATLAGYYAQ